MTPRLSRDEVLAGVDWLFSHVRRSVNASEHPNKDGVIAKEFAFIEKLRDMALAQEGGLVEPIGLEPIRKRLKRGQYRTLPAETTGADIAFLLSLIDNYRSRLHAQEGRWIPVSGYEEAEKLFGRDGTAVHDSHFVFRTIGEQLYAMPLPAPPQAAREGE